MKTMLRVVLGLAVLLVVLIAAAYFDGTTLPVNHSTTVESVVAAPPTKVFGLITDVANAPKWRHAVKGVEVLPQNQFRDHWIEDLGHGTKMNFTAIETDTVSPAGVAKRVVRLTDPQYGGDWTYELKPGPTAGTTDLKITETGYIHPPIFRFMMHHIFGMDMNLKQYRKDLNAAAGA